MKIKEFKLERFFAKYEFSAPYLLCSSDCESFTVEELLSLEDATLEKLKTLRLGYTESQGSPLLREEISRLYCRMEPDNITVFAGAQEGIFIFMNVLLDKEDHIIVQFPCYQSLFEVAEAIGCEVTGWVMRDEDRWEPDMDFLRKAIKKNTRAIIINSPHNPTGYSMAKEKYNILVEIAGERGIYIFSDEVYRFLEYDENKRLPAMCDIYNKGVSLGVMSKSFGLAGLRTGWIATKDRALMKRIASFKDYTTICNSAPSEFFSILALRNKDTLLKRNLKIIKDNLLILDVFFEKYRDFFEWIKPGAGPIAFPSIKFDENTEDFCLRLVREKGVLLLPSKEFDFGEKHFRIGFGRKNMAEGLEKLEEYIVMNM